ncbi:SDR family oxidoreductase [Roseomonas sp. HJA6]|uniref:SDR family oxidoreductase n=1 Tax=Roseomonas alba TaxID=2846776 RepID=A0ABS7ADS5_9PROT|nr:SDR family NAD(P)-dependent oxidoreductase [Neoroseomonas alba]MBW6400451.1 SDR family oxidoreductase [Neoroseomonas alba]
MDFQFDGKCVAITGVGSGFGRAIARSFATMGATVHGCDISAEALALARAEAPVATAQIDLADRTAATEWVHDVEAKVGRNIDILVHNAGGPLGIPLRPIDEFSFEDWDRLFAANIHAAFAVARAALPGMRKARWGRIITISSGAGLKASLSGLHGYAAAKHALVGFTRQLALDAGEFGITVNSVAPGLQMTSPIKQERWDSYTAEKQRGFMSRIALRRLGTPEDIANAAVFFASPMASFITGEVLSVNGGTF